MCKKKKRKKSMCSQSNDSTHIVWRKQDLSEISILFSFKENGPLNEKGKSNTSEEINPKDQRDTYKRATGTFNELKFQESVTY